VIAVLVILNLVALATAYRLDSWQGVVTLLIIETLVGSALAYAFVRGLATPEERP
jgi:hypothetical protein